MQRSICWRTVSSPVQMTGQSKGEKGFWCRPAFQLHDQTSQIFQHCLFSFWSSWTEEKCFQLIPKTCRANPVTRLWICIGKTLCADLVLWLCQSLWGNFISTPITSEETSLHPPPPLSATQHRWPYRTVAENKLYYEQVKSLANKLPTFSIMQS